MKILWCITIVLLAACGNVKSSPGATLSKATFLPEGNYYVSHQKSFSSSMVTEQEFLDIMTTAESIYSPIIKSFGGTLLVESNWNDKTVNAYAERIGNTYKISFFGGLARHSKMTRDGFALVVCHEIGHHLAGYNFYSSSKWASVEGMSDYYATAACAKQLLTALSSDPSDPTDPCDCTDGEKCRIAPEQISLCKDDPELCKRTMSAGQSLGDVLADLGNTPAPRYDTPDKTVVRTTLESHPNAQCRLDTYKAGTLCNKIWDDGVIPRNSSEAAKVACQKPKCWFAK